MARLQGKLEIQVYSDTSITNNPKLRITDISETIADTAIAQFQPLLVQVAASSSQVINFNGVVGEYLFLISDQQISVGVNFSDSITGIADYSGTVGGTVLVSSLAHGRSTGESITISGTSDYNGTYIITKVSDDSFYFTKAYTSSQTGTWASNSTKIPCKRMYIDSSNVTSLTVINGTSNIASIEMGIGK
jgi:hypothetical protein